MALDFLVVASDLCVWLLDSVDRFLGFRVSKVGCGWGGFNLTPNPETPNLKPSRPNLKPETPNPKPLSAETLGPKPLNP